VAGNIDVKKGRCITVHKVTAVTKTGIIKRYLFAALSGIMLRLGFPLQPVRA
jgi:hypothetical protein